MLSFNPSELIVNLGTEGYGCPKCDWATKYQYRNAKRAFRDHYCLHHLDDDTQSEPETVILDFCKYCGALLREGKGTEGDPRCDMCDNGVQHQEDRIQGTFSSDDAEALKTALLG